MALIGEMQYLTIGGSTYVIPSSSVGLNIPYGECSVSSSTVNKTVTVNQTITSLTQGLAVFVKFSNSNTATNPTLTVNSLETKPIVRYGTTAPLNAIDTSWNSGSVQLLIYDGTYWVLAGWLNTTYSSMSSSEISAGTSATPRLITPANLKLAIETWATGGTALDTTFDNSTSGLIATNVQDAIDEVSSNIPTIIENSTTGITIADHSSTSIYGVSSSTTSVIGVKSNTTSASKVTVGSSATDYGVKNTNTPTVIDTTKFNGGSYSHSGFSGGSYTRGSFNGGSLTMSMDSTDTKKLNISFTAATHGNDSFTAASYGTDSFTAASLGSGFYTAGTAATLGSKVPTVSASDVVVPIKDASATTVPVKNSSSTNVIINGTHSITDNGHTHDLN